MNKQFCVLMLVSLVSIVPMHGGGFQILTEAEQQEIRQRESLYRTTIALETFASTLTGDIKRTGQIWGLRLPLVEDSKEWKFSNAPNPIFSGKYWQVQIFEEKVEAFCIFDEKTGNPTPYGKGDVEVRYVYKRLSGKDGAGLFSLSQVILERGVDWVEL
jgi:hypothetical protein